jgi:hypothetical protein
VTYDKPLHVTSAELTRIAHEDAERAEAEERRALQAMLDEPTPVLDQYLDDIERLAAADLVMLLRHADTTALSRDEEERARIAQAGRRLVAELLDGARKLERYRADNGVPQWLQEGAPMLAWRRAT